MGSDFRRLFARFVQGSGIRVVGPGPPGAAAEEEPGFAAVRRQGSGVDPAAVRRFVLPTQEIRQAVAVNGHVQPQERGKGPAAGDFKRIDFFRPQAGIPRAGRVIPRLRRPERPHVQGLGRQFPPVVNHPQPRGVHRAVIAGVVVPEAEKKIKAFSRGPLDLGIRGEQAVGHHGRGKRNRREGVRR
ncbi:MAG: hypothetical protein BWX98_02335 [Candidatus Aminicenantes bacterium ADurb.Bin147]|nr:MAG: hypothetical protein BWX98_02335 [Candidatus Aminicenantes bacterium ADurb.Bin147]